MNELILTKLEEILTKIESIEKKIEEMQTSQVTKVTVVGNRQKVNQKITGFNEKDNFLL